MNATMVPKAPLPTTSRPSMGRHLLSLAGIDPASLDAIFARAEAYMPLVEAPGRRTDELDGYCVANVFFEDSTRTRNSFTRAAQLLSADVVDVTAAGSSASKGETDADTARNIEAMGVHALIVRHGCSGVPHQLSRVVRCSVVNAGDGRHEHPTQGLLDIFTMRRHFGPDLSGLTVAIVGDIANSRVARSNVYGLRALGARIIAVGPPGLAPPGLRAIGVSEVAHDFDAVLPVADVVMMLRVQFERLAGQAFASTAEYRDGYGLTRQRAGRMREHAVVMHPGPINRGLEMDEDVADGPRSIILHQVTHGVAIRMAVLASLLLGPW